MVRLRLHHIITPFLRLMVRLRQHHLALLHLFIWVVAPPFIMAWSAPPTPYHHAILRLLVRLRQHHLTLYHLVIWVVAPFIMAWFGSANTISSRHFYVSWYGSAYTILHYNCILFMRRNPVFFVLSIILSSSWWLLTGYSTAFCFIFIFYC